MQPTENFRVDHLPHTPYRHLSATGSPVVPSWAERRSVYRSGGRTLYLVETSQLDAAQHDLHRLASEGWDVRVTAHSEREAQVALVRSAA